MEKRKKVKYLGCDQDQIKFGNCDDPRGLLEVGRVYEVEGREIHSWHTKLKIEGVKGWFNSVCFE